MRGNKYGVAKKEDRTYKGEVFDSKKEMNYYIKLLQLQTAVNPKNRVIHIVRQFVYPLAVNGVLICKYKLDFIVRYADERIEYIDVKGVKTPVYQLKKKLMKAIYNIEIKEA